MIAVLLLLAACRKHGSPEPAWPKSASPATAAKASSVVTLENGTR